VAVATVMVVRSATASEKASSLKVCVQTYGSSENKGDLNINLGDCKGRGRLYTLPLSGQAGTPGPAGPAGPMGDTGAIGPAGPAGAVGPAGPKGDTGAQGAVGPAGAAGAAGPTGPAGATGARGASFVGTDFVVSAPTDTAPQDRAVTATCPAGEVATGGGGTVVPISPANPVAFIYQSTPTNPSNGPTGWIVRAYSSDPAATWQLQATVTCATPSP
jgi:Collagen triple helix repeat (20 copies)